MKVLIQRVSQASVSVDEKVIGQIKQGLLIYFGVHIDDEISSIEYLAKKCANLRLFADDADKMNLSIQDMGFPVLVVSQFTLYADCQSSGRRPGFSLAAAPEKAIPLYEAFIEALKNQGLNVETGQFGAKMQVKSCNEGPINFIIEHFAKSAKSIS